MVFKIPNVYDCDEILNKFETYLHPDIFYPYNVSYLLYYTFYFWSINNLNVFLQKTYKNNELKFLVDNYDIAKKLHLACYKIQLRNDRKVNVVIVV